MIVLSIPENNVNFLQRMVVDVVLSWLHNAIVIFRFNRVMSYSATFLEILKQDFSSSAFFFLWFFPQKNSGNEKCTIFPFDSLSPNLVALGQRVRDYENSMLTLAKELSLHHLTHCPKVNEISVIIALRFTFSTAYSLKSFLDTESFLNPHFSKSCSFPLTLAATPFATCWHHFNFLGAFFSIWGHIWSMQIKQIHLNFLQQIFYPNEHF